MHDAWSAFFVDVSWARKVRERKGRLGSRQLYIASRDE